jgi:hypothetical protein
VSTDLRVPGQGNTSIRFATGSTTKGPYDLTLDQNSNFTGTLAALGPVSGLGAITSPATSFVSNASAQVGGGFVIKTAEGLGLQYRVYVEDNVIGATSGGIIGKRIKWAPLTRLTGVQVSPAATQVARPAPGAGACSSTQVPFTATGTTSDGATPAVTNLATWAVDPSGTPPFITRGNLVVTGGTTTVPNGCPPTSLGSFTVRATIDGLNVSGTATLTVQ